MTSFFAKKFMMKSLADRQADGNLNRLSELSR
jgi:hypothetical protein